MYDHRHPRPTVLPRVLVGADKHAARETAPLKTNEREREMRDGREDGRSQ